MDCLTLRRIKLATPQEARPEVVAHLHQCGDCAAFVRELEAFEHRLHGAVRVAVPEGLAEQIILRHRDSPSIVPVARESRWFSRTALAMAASVVLAVSALVGYNVIQAREELAESFVAHVLSEPDVLQANENVGLVRLERAFSRYGGQLSGTIGEVRHLGQCRIDGVLAEHILVRTPDGLATLILIPERRASLSRPLTRDGYAVVILPLRGGSLGIVTDSPDRTLEVEKLIKARVRWQS
jgi:hypothetical protein